MATWTFPGYADDTITSTPWQVPGPYEYEPYRRVPPVNPVPMTPDPVIRQFEIDRLRAENERLRRELDASDLPRRRGRLRSLEWLFRGVRTRMIPDVGGFRSNVWLLFLAFLKGDRSAIRPLVDAILEETGG